MNKMVLFGADSIGLAEQNGVDGQPQIDAFHDLSTSLTVGDLQPTENRR